MPNPYLAMIQALEKRIEQGEVRHETHLKDCGEQRRVADKNRHDFRAEVAFSLAGISDRMEKGFTKLGESISKVHERINATDGRVHAVDKQADRRVVGWIIWGMGTAIVILTGALLKVLL